MSKPRKLTPAILKRIIREEKIKLVNEQRFEPNAMRDPMQDFINLVIELLDSGEYPEALISIIETEAKR